MQEFILILVVIFVLFKIFGRANVIYYNQHHHNHHEPKSKVKVNAHRSNNKHSNDDGEYVDYVEIKD
jgi:uncharacterized membrane protein